MNFLPPFNFQKWIDENRDSLKPPVNNKLIWEDSEFIIMVVGGPNQREDYHVDVSEEFFYQIQGDMVLKIIENDKPRDIIIKEGEIFLLPGLIPHSPQRFADTIGLVIERTRQPAEKDGFQWYCDKCHAKLYEEFLHISDIAKQLPEVFQRFNDNPDYRVCKQC